MRDLVTCGSGVLPFKGKGTPPNNKTNVSVLKGLLGIWRIFDFTVSRFHLYCISWKFDNQVSNKKNKRSHKNIKKEQELKN